MVTGQEMSFGLLSLNVPWTMNDTCQDRGWFTHCRFEYVDNVRYRNRCDLPAACTLCQWARVSSLAPTRAAARQGQTARTSACVFWGRSSTCPWQPSRASLFCWLWRIPDPLIREREASVNQLTELALIRIIHNNRWERGEREGVWEKGTGREENKREERERKKKKKK